MMLPGGDTHGPLFRRGGLCLVGVGAHALVVKLALRGGGVEPDRKAHSGHKVTYDSYHSAQFRSNYNNVCTEVVLDMPLALRRYNS